MESPLTVMLASNADSTTRSVESAGPTTSAKSTLAGAVSVICVLSVMLAIVACGQHVTLMADIHHITGCRRNYHDHGKATVRRIASRFAPNALVRDLPAEGRSGPPYRTRGCRGPRPSWPRLHLCHLLGGRRRQQALHQRCGRNHPVRLRHGLRRTPHLRWGDRVFDCGFNRGFACAQHRERPCTARRYPGRS